MPLPPSNVACVILARHRLDRFRLKLMLQLSFGFSQASIWHTFSTCSYQQLSTAINIIIHHHLYAAAYPSASRIQSPEDHLNKGPSHPTSSREPVNDDRQQKLQNPKKEGITGTAVPSPSDPIPATTDIPTPQSSIHYTPPRPQQLQIDPDPQPPAALLSF